jgi:hypothetical protein
MGLLVFNLDEEDLDTDLDTPVWDASFRERARYDALSREIDRLVQSASDDTVVPPCLGSLALLSLSLRRLAAAAANGTYRELFANDGIVGSYLNAAYAAARGSVEHARDPSTSVIGFDDVISAQRRLDAITDELPDELRMPVLEAFVAFARFKNDLA